MFNVQKLFLHVHVPAMYMCILGECRTFCGVSVSRVAMRRQRNRGSFIPNFSSHHSLSLCWHCSNVVSQLDVITCSMKEMEWGRTIGHMVAVTSHDITHTSNPLSQATLSAVYTPTYVPYIECTSVRLAPAHTIVLGVWV